MLQKFKMLIGITVQFVSELECTYINEVMPCVAKGTLQMVKPVF